MSNEKKIKIEEKELKGKKGDKDDIPVKIRTKDGKEITVNFDKLEKDKSESKEDVEFEYKIKEGDK